MRFYLFRCFVGTTFLSLQTHKQAFAHVRARSTSVPRKKNSKFKRLHKSSPSTIYCPRGKAMTHVELYRNLTVAMFRIQRFSNVDMPRFPNKQKITHQPSINDLGTSLPPPPPPRSRMKLKSEFLVCRQSPSLPTAFARNSGIFTTNLDPTGARTNCFHLVQSQTTVFTMP